MTTKFVQEVLVPDDSGVITQIISSPVKHIHVDARARRVGEEQVPAEQDVVDGSQFAISQVLNPSAHASRQGTQIASQAQPADSDSESDSDPEYLPHSEDSGENSEVVELRRHARKFKKKMRDTKSWIGRDLTEAVPLELIGNMEEQVEADEKEWGYDSSDEDYSYDEDSDGQQVRRKSKFPSLGLLRMRFKLVAPARVFLLFAGGLGGVELGACRMASGQGTNRDVPTEPFWSLAAPVAGLAAMWSSTEEGAATAEGTCRVSQVANIGATGHSVSKTSTVAAFCFLELFRFLIGFMHLCSHGFRVCR
ncbi:hypothetical protein ZWY2020_010098 [Hordeum vulgare]|nr:hypothetical protein ZWY2020_010098 [Hordeum vulgare]